MDNEKKLIAVTVAGERFSLGVGSTDPLYGSNGNIREIVSESAMGAVYVYFRNGGHMVIRGTFIEHWADKKRTTEEVFYQSGDQRVGEGEIT